MLNLDLGINKSKKNTRVVVAMSGGVDSSVTAALLANEGYEVIGMTMQLYDHGEVIAKKACCAGIDIYDAKNVAEQIGIAHYVLNYQNIFRESVMEDFADSYIKGETPIPCIRCNETVKFRDMFKMAKQLGGDVLATGHYVQRKLGEYGAELHSAVDKNRDQSYFLFSTTKEQLDFIRFPLGSIDKDTTRQYANEFNLSIANKPDSQDICFVPDGNYAKVVEKLRPGALESGNIIDTEGNVLGTHNGIINYTIGQRRGLNLPNNSGQPLYVIKINAKTHEVVVGCHSHLARQIMNIKGINWLCYPNEDAKLYEIDVKIRSSQSPIPATMEFCSNSKTAKITLLHPEYGVSPGQACVFYQKSRVIGGGWIVNDD